MDRFEYRNFFSANIVPRQGTLLVSGDGKMDRDYHPRRKTPSFRWGM